jgi:hypothetical protein
MRTVLPAFGYGVPITWRARVWQDPTTLGLRFRHLGGATNGMDVAWRIEPADGGCRVTIEHVFDPAAPGWAVFVDRAFVRPVAGRTLATFRTIAEAAALAMRSGRSGTRRTTKEPT